MMSVRNSLGRSFALAALTLAVSAAGADAQQLPPAQQIVDKYVEAIGGRAAVARHKQRRVVTEMTMPAMGLTMTADLLTASPNKMLLKMDAPGMGNMSSGYDGTVAWSNNPMQGPRVLDGQELQEAIRQSDFESGLDYARSYRMETIGEMAVGGRPCWNVKMTHITTGLEMQNCFDKENALLVRTSMKSQSAMGEMQVDVTMSEYKDFDGIKMPTRSVTSMGGQEMTSVIKSVSHAPIDPSVFAPPAEVRALRPQN
jgi:hypothetical protein